MADFNFDVSDANPSWIREEEIVVSSSAEETSRKALRSLDAAHATAGAAAAQHGFRDPRMYQLMTMGFNLRDATAALDAAQGDFDTALLMLVGGD